jgi:hypothetical protein
VNDRRRAARQRRHEIVVNGRVSPQFQAITAVVSLDNGAMKFYRSPLDTGGFEYARVDGDSARAEYFDDELRIWIPCPSLHDEIADDGLWTQCSEFEGEDTADAWPATGFDLSRVVA